MYCRYYYYYFSCNTVYVFVLGQEGKYRKTEL